MVLVTFFAGAKCRRLVILESFTTKVNCETELVIRMWAKRTDAALIVIVAVILGTAVWISSSHVIASIGVAVATAATCWFAGGFVHGFHSPK